MGWRRPGGRGEDALELIPVKKTNVASPALAIRTVSTSMLRNSAASTAFESVSAHPTMPLIVRCRLEGGRRCEPTCIGDHLEGKHFQVESVADVVFCRGSPDLKIYH